MNKEKYKEMRRLANLLIMGISKNPVHKSFEYRDKRYNNIKGVNVLNHEIIISFNEIIIDENRK